MHRLDDLIGKPFADGGRGPELFDCWGLVIEVMRRHGISLPDYQISALAFDRIGEEIERQRPIWKRLDGPIDPCLVVVRFNSSCPNHCGVYLGSGQFIHAREKAKVCIDRINSPAWAHRIEGFYVPA